MNHHSIATAQGSQGRAAPRRLYRPAVTAGLLSSGTVLVATGLTLLPVHYGLVGAWKVWGVFGITPRAVNVLHQLGALGFLTSAGLHMTSNKRVIGKHAEQLANAASNRAARPAGRLTRSMLRGTGPSPAAQVTA